MSPVATPRLLIAATGSGVGKTTVTVALMAALRKRGLKLAPFKCGPDYLDPSYHARAAGAPSHNLDGWMMGRHGVIETFAHAARGSDLAIIEGMMGLFDSSAPDSDEGSSAEIAKWLDAPVILVVDASGIARTIAALAFGFSRFDAALRVAGIICNNVGGRGHLDLLRQAAPAIPIVGGLPRRAAAVFPERHLGLVSALQANLSDACFDEWGAMAAEWFQLDQILAIARSAHAVADEPANPPTARRRCRIGLAYDEAFHFYYEYNLSRLEQCGAEIVRFSPIHDGILPDVDGLYFGGGYPEAAVRELSANHAMLEAVRDFAKADRPIYAECGGLMYLTDAIRVDDGTALPMVGLIPSVAEMSDQLQAIGYAEVETTAPSLLGPNGTRWRGHQFRYSMLAPAPPPAFDRLYRVAPRWGGPPFTEGFRRGNLIASYVHAHWASNPAVAESFVHACAAQRERAVSRPVAAN
jgi:cobyrinic acid a,c-diamide synthase